MSNLLKVYKTNNFYKYKVRLFRLGIRSYRICSLQGAIKKMLIMFATNDLVSYHIIFVVFLSIKYCGLQILQSKRIPDYLLYFALRLILSTGSRE